jgi:hypothetical protein
LRVIVDHLTVASGEEREHGASRCGVGAPAFLTGTASLS